MKLQIAFDELNLDKMLSVAKQLEDYADIFEIGLLPLYKHGILIVEQFRKEFPNKTLFVDTKIIDQGRDIVSICGQAGADWISVMAGAHKQVIHAVCDKAHGMGKKVILDLSDTLSFNQAALESKSLGVDAIRFYHFNNNNESHIFLENWNMIYENTQLPIFIKTDSSLEAIDQIISLKSDGIIVGSLLTKNTNPTHHAEILRKKM